MQEQGAHSVNTNDCTTALISAANDQKIPMVMSNGTIPSHLVMAEEIMIFSISQIKLSVFQDQSQSLSSAVHIRHSHTSLSRPFSRLFSAPLLSLRADIKAQPGNTRKPSSAPDGIEKEEYSAEEKLAESVKNCVSLPVLMSPSLWNMYNDFQKQLGETGHGLVVSDHENEITPDSEISNVWDGANGIDEYNMHSSLPPDSHSGSPGLDDIDWPPSDEEQLWPLTPKVKLTLKHAASPTVTPSQPLVKKKKTPQELAHDIVEGERAAHMEMNLVNAKERTKQEHIKRQAACETALEVEQLCLQHQQEEAACQHAHELTMMERQIYLEQLKAGIDPGPGMVVDPALQGF
ncbi:hypothetical protein EDC04DRAFT_2609790 [Pisolithus marmoratus]|nr:hypothetical protein EDC04DRAFT_2609790 [Pisolithus marmoratus]